VSREPVNASRAVPARTPPRSNPASLGYIERQCPAVQLGILRSAAWLLTARTRTPTSLRRPRRRNRASAPRARSSSTVKRAVAPRRIDAIGVREPAARPARRARRPDDGACLWLGRRRADRRVGSLRRAARGGGRRLPDLCVAPRRRGSGLENRRHHERPGSDQPVPRSLAPGRNARASLSTSRLPATIACTCGAGIAPGTRAGLRC
jgi:hypothetical protein